NINPHRHIVKSAAIFNKYLRINNCTFDNIWEYAVHPYDSEVFVENGCTFNNMPMGVNILYTYPQPFAPHIGNASNNPNDFSCSEYGIHSTSAGSTDPLNIVNNNFLGGQVGIQLNGESYFEVHHNDLLSFSSISIEENSAVAAISTGFNDSGIFENNISSSVYGSQAIWENSGLRYAFNCFGFNTNTDILVNQGNIHPFQEGDRYENNADEYTEAGNCFTKGVVPEIDNTGNNLINYYIKPGVQPGDCEYLDNSLNVNRETGVVADLAANCGTQNSPGNINVVTFCGGPFKTKQEILDKIASIEAYIDQIKNTTYPSETYKNYLLAKYNRCLKRLLAQIGIIILVPDKEPTDDPDGLLRMEDYIAFYSARPEFNYQLLAYGMMIQLNDINRARTYLNGLLADTPEKQDFVWAQNINLDYLDNTTTYTLSPSDEAALLTVAKKRFPLAGYARSIYEALTEKKVDLDLPDRSQNGPRSKALVQDELSISSFPNPANDVYSILLSGAEKEVEYKSYLVDRMGKVVREFVLEKSVQTDLDISRLNDGIYYLQVLDEEEKIMYSTKVVIIH
ncbi:MAG: T9SS type A sorting domain-containing protein, partial [Bacteroidota bacterium]